MNFLYFKYKKSKIGDCLFPIVKKTNKNII